jgi:hypothetical protein
MGVPGPHRASRPSGGARRRRPVHHVGHCKSANARMLSMVHRRLRQGMRRSSRAAARATACLVGAYGIHAIPVTVPCTCPVCASSDSLHFIHSSLSDYSRSTIPMLPRLQYVRRMFRKDSDTSNREVFATAASPAPLARRGRTRPILAVDRTFAFFGFAVRGLPRERLN